MALDFGALQFSFGAQASRAASETAGNRIARVTGLNAAGGYDLEFSSGLQSRNVPSQTIQRWKVGDWVTVEIVGGRPIIVGIATSAAGA